MQIFAAFSNEITLGNALTLLAGLISLAATWGALRADQVTMRKIVEEQGKRLDEIDRTGGTVTNLDRGSLHSTVKDHEDRIRRVESQMGKLDLIALDVHYIKRHIQILNKEAAIA